MVAAVARTAQGAHLRCVAAVEPAPDSAERPRAPPGRLLHLLFARRGYVLPPHPKQSSPPRQRRA
eukprot:8153026-Pyramimonas_sp.AAC.1